MKRSCLHLALVSFALLSFALLGQTLPKPSPTFTISGVVVQGGTNRPLNRVYVAISQNNRPDQQASLITAEDGKFTFTNVPQGKYTLSAEHRGISRMFQQDGPYSTGIVTGPALDSQHLVFVFPVTATILVKVSDEDGEPVRGAQTILFHKRVEGGWSQTEMASQGVTDAEGISRFARLEPGTYFVAATGRPWYAQNGITSQGSGLQAESVKQLDVAYPITYVGQTQDPAAASPIEVSEGESTQQQITLTAVPAAKISLPGITGSPDPARGGQINTTVEAIGPGGNRFQTPAFFYEENNERQILGVAPGHYVVSLSKFVPDRHGQENMGTIHLDAGVDSSSNSSNLARTDVSGSVTFDKAQATGSLAVWLSQPSNSQHAFCPVRSDGIFHCTMSGSNSGALVPGRYQVHLVNSGELYIKSITAKGADFSTGLLALSEGQSASLALVVAKGSTTLNGIALRDGRAVPGALVLLVAVGPERNSGIPRDQSDSDGTFTLRDVHPGRYFLLAIDNGHNLEYHMPGVIDRYLSKAQQITLPLAQDAVVQVTVQNR